MIQWEMNEYLLMWESVSIFFSFECDVCSVQFHSLVLFLFHLDIQHDSLSVEIVLIVKMDDKQTKLLE